MKKKNVFYGQGKNNEMLTWSPKSIHEKEYKKKIYIYIYI